MSCGVSQSFDAACFAFSFCEKTNRPRVQHGSCFLPESFTEKWIERRVRISLLLLPSKASLGVVHVLFHVNNPSIQPTQFLLYSYLTGCKWWGPGEDFLGEGTEESTSFCRGDLVTSQLSLENTGVFSPSPHSATEEITDKIIYSIKILVKGGNMRCLSESRQQLLNLQIPVSLKVQIFKIWPIFTFSTWL